MRISEHRHQHKPTMRAGAPKGALGETPTAVVVKVDDSPVWRRVYEAWSTYDRREKTIRCFVRVRGEVEWLTDDQLVEVGYDFRRNIGRLM